MFLGLVLNVKMKIKKMISNCENCNKTFVRGSGIQRHCSFECRIDFVTKKGKHDDDCDIFMFPLTYSGFPVLNNLGKTVLVHRYIYEKKFGRIPKKMTLKTTCERNNCINTSHMFLTKIAKDYKRDK